MKSKPVISSIDKRLGSAVRKLCHVLKKENGIMSKWTVYPGAHAVSDTGWLLEVLSNTDEAGKHQPVTSLD